MGKKRLFLIAGVLIVGLLVGGPLAVGVVISVLFIGNSCATAAGVLPAEAKSYTGPPAQEWLDSLPGIPAYPGYAGMTAEQRRAEAQFIARVAIEEGAAWKPNPMPIKAVWTNIATGLQESRLHNYTIAEQEYTDRDSLNYLQQRPSQGWGTPEQLEDPRYAARQFYDRYSKLPGTDSMTMKEIALAIQRPSIAAYSSWDWDRTAVELYALVATPGIEQGCEQSGWRGPLDPGTYCMTDLFGDRVHPIYGTRRLHTGTDMACNDGDPVYAVHSGTIDFVGRSGDLGNYVRIDHGRDVMTGYAHLDDFAPAIARGTQVTAGQVIGYVGNTGGSTGPHLHFMWIEQGTVKDPVENMLKVGVDIIAQATG